MRGKCTTMDPIACGATTNVSNRPKRSLFALAKFSENVCNYNHQTSLVSLSYDNAFDSPTIMLTRLVYNQVFMQLQKTASKYSATPHQTITTAIQSPRFNPMQSYKQRLKLRTINGIPCLRLHQSLPRYFADSEPISEGYNRPRIDKTIYQLKARGQVDLISSL